MNSLDKLMRVRNTWRMEKMRVILKQLMARTGDNPYDVQKKSGVTQSITHRYLEGTSNDPRSSTVRQWAKAYGVTESQLRGDVPIDGISVPQEPKELKDILPPDEYKLLSNIKRMDPEARGVVFELFEILSKNPPANSDSAILNRRKRVDCEHNQQLRAGEKYYQSATQKSRTRENFDAPRLTGTS